MSSQTKSSERNLNAHRKSSEPSLCCEQTLKEPLENVTNNSHPSFCYCQQQYPDSDTKLQTSSSHVQSSAEVSPVSSTEIKNRNIKESSKSYKKPAAAQNELIPAHQQSEHEEDEQEIECARFCADVLNYYSSGTEEQFTEDNNDSDEYDRKHLQLQPKPKQKHRQLNKNVGTYKNIDGCDEHEKKGDTCPKIIHEKRYTKTKESSFSESAETKEEDSPLFSIMMKSSEESIPLNDDDNNADSPNVIFSAGEEESQNSIFSNCCQALDGHENNFLNEFYYEHHNCHHHEEDFIQNHKILELENEEQESGEENEENGELIGDHSEESSKVMENNNNSYMKNYSNFNAAAASESEKRLNLQQYRCQEYSSLNDKIKQTKEALKETHEENILLKDRISQLEACLFKSVERTAKKQPAGERRPMTCQDKLEAKFPGQDLTFLRKYSL